MRISATPFRRVAAPPPRLSRQECAHDPPAEHGYWSSHRGEMETTVESNEHRADARLDRLVEPAICVLALVLLNMIVIYVGLLTMMWQSLKLLSCRKPEQRRERVSGIGISAMLTLAGVATLPVSMILGGGVEFGGNAVGNLVSLTTFWTGTTVQLGKLAGAVLLVDAIWRLCRRPRSWSFAPARMVLELGAIAVVVSIGLLVLVTLAIDVDYSVSFAASVLTE